MIGPDRFTGWVLCPMTLTSELGVGTKGTSTALAGGSTGVFSATFPVVLAVAVAGPSVLPPGVSVLVPSPSPGLLMPPTGPGTKFSKPFGPVETFRSVTVPDSRS